ncbi:MAG: hypothetical protein ABA06_00390 [Parcubacteria bacterium C7867-001]|nr:MAG: hypothetical protein ABA06_00390 [Parcubacteria bacterium C7867-001]
MKIAGIGLALVMFAMVSGCGPSAKQVAEATASINAQDRALDRRDALDRLMKSLRPVDQARFEMEMFRVRDARELRLGDNASKGEILRARKVIWRAEELAEYKLPATATDEDLYAAKERKWLKEDAKDLGLPVSASKAQVDAARKAKYDADSEKSRVRMALDLGLPATASWKEIETAEADRRRVDAALRHGLPKTATWVQISRKADEDNAATDAKYKALRRANSDYEKAQDALEDAQRRIDALEAGLPETASRDQIEEHEINRVRRYAAANLGLSEGSSWGLIFDATQHDSRY